MRQASIPDAVLEKVRARTGRRHAYDHLDPGATALVAIDMQSYFVDIHRRFASGDKNTPALQHGQDIVQNINRLAAELRWRGGLVVWIYTAAPLETLESWANFYEIQSPATREERVAGLSEGSPGFALWPQMQTAADDLAVIKTRYSALIPGSSSLEKTLIEHKIDTVLIAGIATNVCCESTARDAMMLGYRTVMVSDSTATTSDDDHVATLTNFVRFFGDVQDTDTVIGHFT